MKSTIRFDKADDGSLAVELAVDTKPATSITICMKLPKEAETQSLLQIRAEVLRLAASDLATLQKFFEAQQAAAKLDSQSAAAHPSALPLHA